MRYTNRRLTFEREERREVNGEDMRRKEGKGRAERKWSPSYFRAPHPCLKEPNDEICA